MPPGSCELEHKAPSALSTGGPLRKRSPRPTWQSASRLPSAGPAASTHPAGGAEHRPRVSPRSAAGTKANRKWQCPAWLGRRAAICKCYTRRS